MNQLTMLGRQIYYKIRRYTRSFDSKTWFTLLMIYCTWQQPRQIESPLQQDPLAMDMTVLMISGLPFSLRSPSPACRIELLWLQN